jgi:thiosulfate/3-mercaptopyruvate sulfurtransferase
MKTLLTAVVATASLWMPAPALQAQARPAAAAVARPAMLVSTEWLATHARDADLVVLHVGRRAQYDSGHMAGARFVALAEVSTPAGPGTLTLQMPSIDELAAWARSQGIGDRSRILVVPHDDTLQSATRVFLTLAYLGAMERTSLLDGGFKAWKAEGRTVTTDAPPAPAAVRFTPRPRPELIATIDQVEAATKDGTLAIVDARLPRFYEGNGGGYPRPGHIPTAVNIPLTSVSTATGHLRIPTELRKLFLDAGVGEGKPVVTYCHIGQQASLLWFVATLLGHDARMYDGSFQEWSSTERMPVVLKK